MHGCSGAILVLNVLNDSACHLKGKEGRSLGYSVTLGTFLLVLFQTHTHFPSYLFYLSISNTHTCIYLHTFPDICAIILCCSAHIPVQFTIISWYAAPSTGSLRSTSPASHISASHYPFPLFFFSFKPGDKPFLETVTCSRGSLNK